MFIKQKNFNKKNLLFVGGMKKEKHKRNFL